jgi:prepilin-type N-terminal cleavage/methylation domain-containing protein
MKKQHGFTLIELMIVISLVGILMSVAAPGMRTYISNSAANSLSSTLYIDIMHARNYAVTQQVIVKMLPLGTESGASTFDPATSGVNWGFGWVSFVDADDDGLLDADETVIRRHESFGSDAHISSGPGAHLIAGTPDTTYDSANPPGFDANGFPISDGVFSIAQNGCAGPNAQTIQINAIGQIISRETDCPDAFTEL